MTSTEKDRLDLRQEFERLFNNKRIAEIAMEAMPPVDYSQLATKQDLQAIDAKLTGEMAMLRGEFAGLKGEFTGLKGEFTGLRGEMAELRGELKGDIASNLRYVLAGQVTTMMMLGGWVTAVT